jgi:hypothetical protein
VLFAVVVEAQPEACSCLLLPTTTHSSAN